MTSNLHPTFAAILKPHLQGQTIVARKRDTIRFKALRAGYAAIVGLDPEPTLSFYDFVAGVDKYEAAQTEAHLDAQYEAAMKRSGECVDQMHEALRDLRQAENDREWEQAVIEARERFANEGDAK